MQKIIPQSLKGNTRIIKPYRKSYHLTIVNHGKKDHNSSFDVTMGSYDGAELCQFIGTYIQSLLESTLEDDKIGLCQDDGVIIVFYTFFL